jgi:hypothetical protein
MMPTIHIIACSNRISGLDMVAAVHIIAFLTVFPACRWMYQTSSVAAMLDVGFGDLPFSSASLKLRSHS